MDNIFVYVKTDDGLVFQIEVDDFMTCQKEYDLNLDHNDSIGLFWDFFNYYFRNILSGKEVFKIDKNSPGYANLLEQQRAWRKYKERKRLEARAWRNNYNRLHARRGGYRRYA